jgi:hypothetical protein
MSSVISIEDDKMLDDCEIYIDNDFIPLDTYIDQQIITAKIKFSANIIIIALFCSITIGIISLFANFMTLNIYIQILIIYESIIFLVSIIFHLYLELITTRKTYQSIITYYDVMVKRLIIIQIINTCIVDVLALVTVYCIVKIEINIQTVILIYIMIALSALRMVLCSFWRLAVYRGFYYLKVL